MSIFEGVEPPRWLQELTSYKKGQFGESLGLALGAGLLAIQPNDSGDGVKGFEQGLAEARMNQADPNWKVKEAQAVANATSNWARAATEWQQFDANSRDMAQWTTKDLPALSKYQEDLKQDPDAPPPVMTSSRGQQAAQQIEAARLRRATLDFKKQSMEDTLDIRRTQAENGSEAAKAALEDQKLFNKTLATVNSPSVRSQIRALTKNGAATPEAWAALDSAEKTSPEQEKVEGRIKVAQATGQQKVEFEKQRQTDRMALEDLKQKGRVQIEKMKELSRTDANGKTLSRKDFINRHFNTVFTNLRKNAADDETPTMTADKAEKLLSGVYYRVDKSDQSAAAKQAPAAPQAQPQTAPAAAAKTDDSDPLGILK